MRTASDPLSVEPVNGSTRDAVLVLEVLPEHVAFSGLPSEALPLAETDPPRIPMAVLESNPHKSGQSDPGRVVGFFALC